MNSKASNDKDFDEDHDLIFNNRAKVFFIESRTQDLRIAHV